MKRHKIKNSSGKNKVFYIHISNVHTPLPVVEDSYSVDGPSSKEEFEDFRYEDWEKQIWDLSNEDAIVALTRHEAEKLYSKLGRMLSDG